MFWYTNTMTSVTIVFIGIAVIVLASNAFAIWYLIHAARAAAKNVPDKGIDFLQREMQGLRETFDRRIGDSTKEIHNSMQTQMSESQKLSNEITKHLLNVERGVAETKESSKQVFSLGEQLQNFEKVLKHQKQRGNLGEASLELILSNMLPPEAYKLQYPIGQGRVDAVVVTKDGVIPVDAKFSLDNYNRLISEDDESKRKILEKEFTNDLKKRIDETAKYISPKEGTLPFAFMYIPAEGIYYDLLVNEVGALKVNTRNLIDYAYSEKNVVIVSPTTFSAYLKSVLYGFNAYKIEKSAQEIRKNVEKLAKHLNAYEEFQGKMGIALQTMNNRYDDSVKEFGKINKDILKIDETVIPVGLGKPTE